MISSVLRGERAVEVNLAIVRAFIRMREALATNKDLASRLTELEQRYDAIRQLMIEPEPHAKRIGFQP